MALHFTDAGGRQIPVHTESGAPAFTHDMPVAEYLGTWGGEKGTVNRVLHDEILDAATAKFPHDPKRATDITSEMFSHATHPDTLKGKPFTINDVKTAINNHDGTTAIHEVFDKHAGTLTAAPVPVSPIAAASSMTEVNTGNYKAFLHGARDKIKTNGIIHTEALPHVDTAHQHLEDTLKAHFDQGGKALTTKDVHNLMHEHANVLQGVDTGRVKFKDAQDGHNYLRERLSGTRESVLKQSQQPIMPKAPPGTTPPLPVANAPLSPQMQLLHDEVGKLPAGSKIIDHTGKQIEIKRIIGKQIEAGTQVSPERMRDAVQTLGGKSRAELQALAHDHADVHALLKPRSMELIHPDHRRLLEGSKMQIGEIHPNQYAQAKAHVADELAAMSRSTSAHQRLALRSLNETHLNKAIEDHTRRLVDLGGTPHDPQFLKNALTEHVPVADWAKGHKYELTAKRKDLLKHLATDTKTGTVSKEKWLELINHDKNMHVTHKFTTEADYHAFRDIEHKVYEQSHMNLMNLPEAHAAERVKYNKMAHQCRGDTINPIHDHIVQAKGSPSYTGKHFQVKDMEGHFRTGKCGTIVHVVEGHPPVIVQHGKDAQKFLQSVEKQLVQEASHAPSVMSRTSQALSKASKSGIKFAKGAGKVVLIGAGVGAGLWALSSLMSSSPTPPRRTDYLSDLEDDPLTMRNARVDMGAMAVPQMGQQQQMGGWASRIRAEQNAGLESGIPQR